LVAVVVVVRTSAEVAEAVVFAPER